MQTAKRERLDCLDVARGGAALLVLLEHGLHWSVPSYLAFSQQHVVIGQAAILVFFMISGFVVPMSLEALGSVGGFWRRRCFRLFPVYWASIAFAAVALAAGFTQGIAVQLNDYPAWAANLLILQTTFGQPSVLGVFWSLHYEVLLYVAFSLLFAFRLLPRMNAKMFALVLIAYVLVSCVRPLLLHKQPAGGYMRQVLLAALFGWIARQHVAGRITRRPFFALLAGVFAANTLTEAANATMLAAHEVHAMAIRQAVIMTLGFGSFAFLIDRRERTMPRVIQWIGQRSYPIYLMHPLVLTFLVGTGLPPVMFVTALILATLLVAELVHRSIELPGVALGRRFERRRHLKSEGGVAVIPFPTRQAIRKAA